MAEKLRLVSASELAIALGLDPSQVSRIIITASADSTQYVSVEISMLMTKEKAAEFLNKSYKLAEAQDDPAA